MEIKSEIRDLGDVYEAMELFVSYNLTECDAFSDILIMMSLRLHFQRQQLRLDTFNPSQVCFYSFVNAMVYTSAMINASDEWMK